MHMGTVLALLTRLGYNQNRSQLVDKFSEGHRGQKVHVQAEIISTAIHILIPEKIFLICIKQCKFLEKNLILAEDIQ